MFSVPGIALVTGAGSGIGRATALAFARAGASGLHLTDVNRGRLEETRKDVTAEATNPHFKAYASEAELSKEDQVVRMVQEAADNFGRIDYAANIAGISENSPMPTADTPLATYDRINNINAKGVFLCMREQLKVMRNQEAVARIPGRPGVRGAIVNMSSMYGFLSGNGYTSYVTSKHAVIGMTRAAAVSHSVDDIRVNAVCPGYIDTPLVDNIKEHLDLRTFLEGAVPMKRLGMAEEIADVVVFLLSERASFVTGHSFIADGGASIV
ncbi:3-oxoacyl-reductase [Guyanagaster necrorhizus]|uniref:3-oxoacyl-reductase n=1 Tax=Guyanagaster necrorhizus TaxID=856835 RepID=A0A9P7VT75_9AGAR|nr:3-oxoacyl-reductase [Guyanagaster necrorhizus MCA 3950]KAG7446168.1 3-oxoacyl-reductase [Guyanagaster necrorhizus MCA 3950]